ncbi:carbohydrate ABC transporter permease [Paenibacillus solisilvae]|uniref:Carbohydrate ABC transporter permease n=1 Tax=Paenibacillus solisilvae TaxID=2486751 RepID=A0ABW0VXB5_9BACL
MNKTRKIRNGLVVFSFLSPAVLLYGLFMIYPIGEAVRLSLFDWNGAATSMNFIGLDNYIMTMKDPFFVKSLQHNVVWLGLDLVLLVVPVLVLAVMIGKVRKGMLFFRAGYYLPAVLSLPVVSVLWGKIYDPFIGPINLFLRTIGLGQFALNWLGDSWLVLPAIIVAGAWSSYGLFMILFLAGLQNIDYALYESAEIDGAGPAVKFWHITIPSLRNTMNLIISLVIIYGFKSFALVWIMTQGGPYYSSELVASYVYKAAFIMNKVSYGSAGSIILALIVVVLTILFNSKRDKGAA